jgi:energy-coupling factor transport system ATP-binding protein
MTIIILDQDTEKLCNYCDRVVVMDKGRIINVGAPEEVFPSLSPSIRSAIRIPQILEFFELLKSKKGLSVSAMPVNLDSAEALWKGMNLGLSFKDNKDFLDKGSQEKEAIVEIQDLTYIYPGNIKALEGIRFDIKKGDFVGIVGQNGSGKTTLVKHLIGLLSATSGKVLISKTDVHDKSVGQLARKVGFVFQNPNHQIFTALVRHELSYGPKNLSVSESEVEVRVNKIAKALGLEDYLEVDPFQLSRGEMQRVAIGSILTMEPEILVLDEPTTGLYTEEVRETLNYIKKLNQIEGLTVLLISHDMRLIAEYCDRVIILSNGNLIANDTVRSVFRNIEVLDQAALRPPQITQFSMLVDRDPKYAILSARELADHIV